MEQTDGQTDRRIAALLNAPAVRNGVRKASNKPILSDVRNQQTVLREK